MTQRFLDSAGPRGAPDLARRAYGLAYHLAYHCALPAVFAISCSAGGGPAWSGPGNAAGGARDAGNPADAAAAGGGAGPDASGYDVAPGQGPGSSGALGDGGGPDANAPRDAGLAAASDSAAGPDGQPNAGGAGGEGPLPGGLLAFPAPGSQGVCADAPLRITFSGPPTLGSSGKVQVFDLAQPAAPVAAVDMAATTFTNTIGGMLFQTLRPAYVDGNDAVFYLNSHSLAYGHTYYVTVDAGAVRGPGGAAVSVAGSAAWRFSTVGAAPPSSAMSVALTGASPFCSVQGALDAIPASNKSAITITLAAGTYHEIVHASSKNGVTLQGADRATTVIAATNNNILNPSTVGRSLVGIDGSTGFTVKNLTIRNLTPGGSQAEALRLQRCDQCEVRDTNIISLQDTILWDGRLYADNCYIAGNVDFTWGGGTAYFNNCEIKDLAGAGWNVQARNPATTYGYVFVDSRLTSDPGITGHGLARIDVSAFPASNVAYVNCQMGSHISPIGWTITGGTDFSQLRFWEYQSVSPSGTPIDTSKRAPGSVQLTAAQAAMIRAPSVVLAGWQPP